MGEKFELGTIVSKLKEGKKAKEVAKELGISKSNLSYYLRKLKENGTLIYKGNGVWLVQNFNTHTQVKKQRPCRGHAFIWNIKFGREIDWKKQIDKSKYKYKLQSNNKVIRIIENNKKIWLSKKGMLIFEPKDFFGENSYQAKGKAVFELDRTIKKVLNELGLSLISYMFKTSREHFGLIKNELARQYNDNGEKLYIKNEDGKEWMWIDDSLSLGELETNEMNVNKQLQDFWNDHKRTKFQVTPTFILERMNQVTQNQVVFDKNIVKHQELLDKIGNGINDLVKEVKKLNENKKSM